MSDLLLRLKVHYGKKPANIKDVLYRYTDGIDPVSAIKDAYKIESNHGKVEFVSMQYDTPKRSSKERLYAIAQDDGEYGWVMIGSYNHTKRKVNLINPTILFKTEEAAWQEIGRLAHDSVLKYYVVPLDVNG